MGDTERVRLQVYATGLPGPLAIKEAVDRLQRSADALGLTLVEPINVDLTDRDTDGVQSLTDRWVVASANILPGERA